MRRSSLVLVRMRRSLVSDAPVAVSHAPVPVSDAPVLVSDAPVAGVSGAFDIGSQFHKRTVDDGRGLLLQSINSP